MKPRLEPKPKKNDCYKKDGYETENETISKSWDSFPLTPISPSPLFQNRKDRGSKKSNHETKMHFRVMKQTTEVLVQGSFIIAYNLFVA